VNSSPLVIMLEMLEKRDTHTEEQQDKPRGWRPWRPKRKPTPGWTGFGGKTLWDWLQLLSALAIPVVLAVAGFWFTAEQDTRQQSLENQRAQQAQDIENQRAEAERELANERAQDEALQAYLSQMSSLLLENDLRASEADSEMRTLARSRTLTVLGRLDPSRKVAVMDFLQEADLIQTVEQRAPIIALLNADLSDADLDEATLGLADLSDADLSDANLDEAYLGEASLWSANLRGVSLSDADLSNADLNNTDGITHEELEQQAYSLEGATLPNGTKTEPTSPLGKTETEYLPNIVTDHIGPFTLETWNWDTKNARAAGGVNGVYMYYQNPDKKRLYVEVWEFSSSDGAKHRGLNRQVANLQSNGYQIVQEFPVNSHEGEPLGNAVRFHKSGKSHHLLWTNDTMSALTTCEGIGEQCESEDLIMQFFAESEFF
jgi:uncharacterized protein YjbI with pentapeptide repeats